MDALSLVCSDMAALCIHQTSGGLIIVRVNSANLGVILQDDLTCANTTIGSGVPQHHEVGARVKI